MMFWFFILLLLYDLTFSHGLLIEYRFYRLMFELLFFLGQNSFWFIFQLSSQSLILFFQLTQRTFHMGIYFFTCFLWLTYVLLTNIVLAVERGSNHRGVVVNSFLEISQLSCKILRLHGWLHAEPVRASWSLVSKNSRFMEERWWGVAVEEFALASLSEYIRLIFIDNFRLFEQTHGLFEFMGTFTGWKFVCAMFK